MPELRVCEFYSGIGGYHTALSLLPNTPFSVVGAFEISSNANQVYRLNFPDTPVFETNLCGLTASKLDALTQTPHTDHVTPEADHVTSEADHVTSEAGHVTSEADHVTSEAYHVTSEAGHVTSEILFVMSPPCQPFTRQGARKDNLDPRTESVLHLFDIFSELESLPDYFLLENVQGFEFSQTRDRIMAFFSQHSYHVQEYLLNSNQLGIPNSRLRYFLLARKRPFPVDGKEGTIRRGVDMGMKVQPALSEYLDVNPGPEYELGDKFLGKWGRLLDIVTPSSTRSCCFTKAYTTKAEGAGSVIQQAPDMSDVTPGPDAVNPDAVTPDSMVDNARSLTGIELEGEAFRNHMKSLDLRFFTPREIARIHGIPEDFKFPESLSRKQCYRLLGNGLNVTVVKFLLQEVLLKQYGS